MSEAECDRFEREGLARFASRAEPDEHERGCTVCAAERARYEKIGRAVAGLPAHPPPEGWQERVIASLDRLEGEAKENKPASRRMPRWAWLVAATVALAALVAIANRAVLRGGDGPLAMEQQVISTAGSLRADGPAVGNRLRVTVTAGRARVVELRVYRAEKKVVLRCPGDQGCAAASDRRLTGEVELTSPGAYRAIAIAGDRSPPEPAGSLDEDVRAAAASGLVIELGQTLTVH